MDGRKRPPPATIFTLFLLLHFFKLIYSALLKRSANPTTSSYSLRLALKTAPHLLRLLPNQYCQFFQYGLFQPGDIHNQVRLPLPEAGLEGALDFS